jgi:WD40 repeat protein
LTSSAEGLARIWDVNALRPTGAAIRHGGEIWKSVFSPDGKLVLTASADHTARLWDVATGRPVSSPLRHRLSVMDAAFSPDGTLVVTASEDRTAKFWETGTAAIDSIGQSGDFAPTENDLERPPPRVGVRYTAFAFNADRSAVVLGSEKHGLARVVEAASGQPVGPPMIHRWPHVRAVAFSPDGDRVATASHDRSFGEGGGTSATCQIWDAATGRPVSPLLRHINYVAALAFRPDGKVLATADYSGAIHLWDVATGEPVGQPRFTGSIAIGVSFSNDGKVLATATTGRAYKAVLWDLVTGTPRGEPIQCGADITGLVFSPGDRRLAVASTDGRARLIDVASGRAEGEPLRHTDGLRGVAFSPDGTLLLTACYGPPETSALRLWNVGTGRAVSSALTLPSPAAMGAVVFSPDGRTFAAGCEDGSVHLWEVASTKPIGPPRMLRDPVIGLAFSRDGRSVVGVDDRGHVNTWRVHAVAHETAEQLVARLQARTGLELGSTREPGALDTENWRELRKRQGASPRESGSDDDLEWHEARARDAEALGDWFGARWHLDRLVGQRPGDGLAYARRALTFLEAGDRLATRADLVTAIHQGPRGHVIDWLMQRSVDLRAGGRPSDALFLLDLVGAAGPGDWRTHALRAEVLAILGHTAGREIDVARAIELGADASFLIRIAAARGRAGLWWDAVQLYHRAIARGTVPYEVWQQAALAHLKIGDEDGYRRLCADMRGHFPTPLAERWVAKALVEVCTFGPRGVGDDGKAVAWAEFVHSSLTTDRVDLRHVVGSLLGAALYRSGRFRDAVDRIHLGIAEAAGQISFLDATVLALAYHACGDDAQARRMLARQGMDETSQYVDDYWDVEARNLLRREARQLILDPPFPASPFAK